MGCKGSKRKLNKKGEKQKLCKIGLGVGRNDLKLEGNFQLGYQSKIYKKYEPVETVDAKPLESIPNKPLTPITEEQEEEATIPEGENGRVLDTGVLQS